MPHILDAVSHMKPMMFMFFFFFLTWMYVFWGISVFQILFQYKYCGMSAPDICFLLFLFPFCGLPPLHIHHLQELLKASVYVCVWVQVCICVCACISPMQLQGLGHHAPEIWWTSAIKGRKTCDRYAAKNTLPPSFFVPPFPVGFVSELCLLMLNYQSDFFFYIFHTTSFIYLSMQLKTTIFFLIKAAILDSIVDP